MSPTNPPTWRRATGKAALTHGARAAASGIITTLGWPVIAALAAVAVAVAGVLLASLIVAASRLDTNRAALQYQCQSRLGNSIGNTASATMIAQLSTDPDNPATPTTTWQVTVLQPATTTTPTVAPTTANQPDPTGSEPTPTTNPYATLSVPPTADANTTACAHALKTGQLVGPPLHSTSGATGRKIAELAAAQQGLQATLDDGTLAGPTNNAFSPANLIRYLYYQASNGTSIMPHTLAEQISVGDRIDPQAVSPGDLVFYNFTPDAGPTAVMIALNSTQGVRATPTETITAAPLPTGNVVIKRPRPDTAATR
jgi:hypothetical protein